MNKNKMLDKLGERLKDFCFAIGDDNDREGVLDEIDKIIKEFKEDEKQK